MSIEEYARECKIDQWYQVQTKIGLYEVQLNWLGTNRAPTTRYFSIPLGCSADEQYEVIAHAIEEATVDGPVLIYSAGRLFRLTSEILESYE